MSEQLEVTVKLPHEIVEFLQKWTAFVGEPLDDFFKDAIIRSPRHAEK